MDRHVRIKGLWIAQTEALLTLPAIRQLEPDVNRDLQSVVNGLTSSTSESDKQEHLGVIEAHAASGTPSTVFQFVQTTSGEARSSRQFASVRREGLPC